MNEFYQVQEQDCQLQIKTEIPLDFPLSIIKTLDITYHKYKEDSKVEKPDRGDSATQGTTQQRVL